MRADLISLNFNVPQCDTSLRNFPVIIGYAPDAGICLDDSTVSNYHCQIDLINGELIVEDLGSVHGTYVNNCRIEKSTLNHGDELSLGILSFLVQFDRLTENYSRPLSREEKKQISPLAVSPRAVR